MAPAVTIRVKALDRPIPDGMAITTVVCALALTAQILRGIAHRLAPWRY